MQVSTPDPAQPGQPTVAVKKPGLIATIQRIMAKDGIQLVVFATQSCKYQLVAHS